MRSYEDSSQEESNVDFGDDLEGDGSTIGIGMLCFSFSFGKLVCMFESSYKYIVYVFKDVTMKNHYNKTRLL